MHVVIDRFEGNYAVCETEDKKMINIEIAKLSPGAKEGDVLLIIGNNIKIDTEKTSEKKNEIKKLMDELWE